MPSFLKNYALTLNKYESCDRAKVSPGVVDRRLQTDEEFIKQVAEAEIRNEEEFRKPINRLRSKKSTQAYWHLACAKLRLPEFRPNTPAVTMVQNQTTHNAQNNVVILPEELREQWRERLKV